MRPAHCRLKIDAPRHQRRILRHKDILEQQRARHRPAHAERIPVADHGHAARLCGQSEIERISAGGVFSSPPFGTTPTPIIGKAPKTSKNHLSPYAARPPVRAFLADSPARLHSGRTPTPPKAGIECT